VIPILREVLTTELGLNQVFVVIATDEDDWNGPAVDRELNWMRTPPGTDWQILDPFYVAAYDITLTPKLTLQKDAGNKMATDIELLAAGTWYEGFLLQVKNKQFINGGDGIQLIGTAEAGESMNYGHVCFTMKPLKEAFVNVDDFTVVDDGQDTLANWGALKNLLHLDNADDLGTVLKRALFTQSPADQVLGEQVIHFAKDEQDIGALTQATMGLCRLPGGNDWEIVSAWCMSADQFGTPTAVLQDDSVDIGSPVALASQDTWYELEGAGTTVAGGSTLSIQAETATGESLNFLNTTIHLRPLPEAAPEADQAAWHELQALISQQRGSIIPALKSLLRSSAPVSDMVFNMGPSKDPVGSAQSRAVLGCVLPPGRWKLESVWGTHRSITGGSEADLHIEIDGATVGAQTTVTSAGTFVDLTGNDAGQEFVGGQVVEVIATVPTGTNTTNAYVTFHFKPVF
jgi:hypothetical protein